MKVSCVLGFLLLLAVLTPADTNIAVSLSLDWERMEINATMALDLTAAGIRLPTGRSQAEEILNLESPDLLRPYLLSIPVDSSSTLEDLARRGEFSLRAAGSLVLSARKTPPALSPDLRRLSTAYAIDLIAISSQLIRHSRALDVAQPLRPVPAASYTGIIIIANNELPIHGRQTEALVRPCIFPKIWDTNMNLIYERNMMEPSRGTTNSIVRYVSQDAIFQSGPSGLSPELTGRVGSNPLRILARGVYGILPTDLIIDQEDALVILSSNENRLLLREGRVAVVLSERVLKETR